MCYNKHVVIKTKGRIMRDFDLRSASGGGQSKTAKERIN